MGVSVRLSDADLRVVSGEETVCTVTLSNTGTVVDQATVEVVGPSAEWSVVEPPMLNLYPGESGEVRVRFAPPRSPAPPAGAVPFGIRVRSGDDLSDSVVEEGTLDLAPFTDLRAELLPQTSQGVRRGRHRLDLANQGNVPVGAEVVLADPDDRLRFAIKQPRVRTEPGASSEVTFLAIPRRTFLRGPQQNRPFQVSVLPDQGEPVSLAGTFEQRPLVPKWAVTGAVALLALGIVLATLWFGLLRPAIRSAAEDAAEAQVSPAVAAAAQAKEQAARAEQKADEAGGPSPGAAGPDATGGGDGPGAAGAEPVPLTRPFDFRIPASAAPRTSGFDFFTSSQRGDRPLDVTDIQLQNPAGDTGILRLLRDDAVIFEFGLENFRDYDNHFVVPLRFGADEELRVAVRCRNAGSKRCTSSVTVSGKTTP
ncbi:COG1470 family protein [Plantactinospora sp. CA-290183]|uniref:COG1470 family protein n=1 Tax=Plantactinospora sp. CA-290183 TaxID=3240006 RepID=UPI003D94F513